MCSSCETDFASLIFLNAFSTNVGWRLAFLMGPALALVVRIVGRTLPESSGLS